MCVCCRVRVQTTRLTLMLIREKGFSSLEVNFTLNHGAETRALSPIVHIFCGSDFVTAHNIRHDKRYSRSHNLHLAFSIRNQIYCLFCWRNNKRILLFMVTPISHSQLHDIISKFTKTGVHKNTQMMQTFLLQLYMHKKDSSVWFPVTEVNTGRWLTENVHSDSTP